MEVAIIMLKNFPLEFNFNLMQEVILNSKNFLDLILVFNFNYLLTGAYHFNFFKTNYLIDVLNLNNFPRNCCYHHPHLLKNYD
jgi:hypothetical protein